MAVKKKTGSVKRKVGRPAVKTTRSTKATKGARGTKSVRTTKSRKVTGVRGRKKTTTRKKVTGATRGRKKTTGTKKTGAKKATRKRKRAGTTAKKPAKKVQKPRKVREPSESTPFEEPETDGARPSIFPTTFKAAGNKQLREFLAEKKTSFEVIKHSPAFTAQQIAAIAHVSGKNIAKTVIVKINGELAMIVEPAHVKIDLDAVKRQLNAASVELASESEFRSRFHNCEVGAMPPFGNLYNMDVYISDQLSNEDFILFNACTHSELIKMSYKDFYNLAHPKVLYL